VADNYCYRGRCPRTGQWLELPRTERSEAIARQLMVELGEHLPEGKMFGILIGRSAAAEEVILKAFSGLWQGQSELPGWVPPIPGRQQVAALEIETLEELGAIARELQKIQDEPLRLNYAQQLAASRQARQQLNEELQLRRQERQQRRDSGEVGLELEQASREDSRAKRQLKDYWRSILAPLETAIAEVDAKAHQLRQQRKTLSRQLQDRLHQTTTIQNFAGEVASLQTLSPASLPTGTGDCCAPKLLHAAATQGIQPIAMAEFWWGTASGDKQPGEFYPACVERCQPLMGFLLSGLSAHLRHSWDKAKELQVLYEDEWVVAIDKPSGLLSVPGRYGQDHVVQRLQLQFGNRPLYPVHRLDLDTSGILLIAKDLDSYRKLAGDFAAGRVTKIYQGVVDGVVERTAGTIDLPLTADIFHRPRQQVDWESGKPSQTRFRLLEVVDGRSRSVADSKSRLEFQPLTGRTHQIRVHSAVGLGRGLVGDRLYGQPETTERLHLHAQRLIFPEVPTGRMCYVESTVPF
jgi:tRNA pseudouridine32 synthase / 23S rRNA pseudouridine746 synthase